jgi:ergothioneine biosynthesis protein EgtB
MTSTAATAPPEPASWPATRYRDVRAATRRLCEPLSPEDAAIQSMEDASPAKWHLAHTSWFFETFLLAETIANYRPFHPDYEFLFNSYYNSVGPQYSRPRRGLLSRPPLEEILEYREHVDARMLPLLEEDRLPPKLRAVVELGLHHEQQHQELILTDLKHMLSHNPLRPVYRATREPSRSEVSPPRWLAYEEGLRWIGHDGEGFAFDNEGPRHQVYLQAFELASRPVTNGEYMAFLEDDGYRRPELWLADAWAVLNRQEWRAPLYWEMRDERWFALTLGGFREVREEDPVCHVSYYEADAYANWIGARLASEQEWECAAAGTAVEGNFVEDDLLHPTAAADSGDAPAQLFGDVWEWTRSAYAPYPGYRAPAGALGEYNGKFMCNQMTLRGGSCATPRSHVRPTYRNFFFPDARWQFSGIRLARDPS